RTAGEPGRRDCVPGATRSRRAESRSGFASRSVRFIVVKSGSGFRWTHRLDQVEDPLSNRRIGNPVIGADELKRFAAAERVVAERILMIGLPGWPAGWYATEIAGQRIGHVIEEEADRHVQHAGQIEQARCSDPIYATLIFLHLLERQAEGFAEPLLAHAQQGPAETDTRANMHIYGTRATFPVVSQ